MLIDTTQLDPDRTMPPLAPLRVSMATELFDTFPRLAGLVQLRPGEGESVRDHAARLLQSETPEDALVLTAFALRPRISIRWARGLLGKGVTALAPADAKMLALIDAWLAYPGESERHAVMCHALFAPTVPPAGMLGLAVGWSGGSFAPNDTSPVPPFRAPRAVAGAVLAALATTPTEARETWLREAMDRGFALFGTA